MWMRSTGTTAARNRVFFIIYVVIIAIGIFAAYEWLALGEQPIVFEAGTVLTPFGLWMIWIDFIALDCR